MAEHSRETLDFQQFADEYCDKHDVPVWKARRMSISLSHSDNVETKILEG
jgi:hypothetical protein